MNTFVFTIQPRSDFGTPLAGDTLFGQVCWAIRERFGEQRLRTLLEGYTAHHPFLVISDGLPAGWLPRPCVPDYLLGHDTDPAARKAQKRKTWLPLAGREQPLSDWLMQSAELEVSEESVTTKNTVDRFGGATPRQVGLLHLTNAGHTGAGFSIYCALDEARLSPEELHQVLADIGQTGFGRDATTGLGKFDVSTAQAWQWPGHGKRHALTLAPCAPQADQLHAARCYYHPQTRFGRHGNLAVLSGQPFKKPILFLKTGALLEFRETGIPAWHGTGLGGTAQPLSSIIPATVHQGYAPLVPLVVEWSA